MREMRRKDRMQTENEARNLLETCEYCIIATINEDGTPYCVPISPVMVDDSIYFHCALEGQKLDNIKNNPKVCLTCVGKTKVLPDKFTTEYESAVVYGEAHILEDLEEKIYALRKICEKYCTSNMGQFGAALERSINVTAICKIKIQTITGKAKKPKEG